MMEPLELEYREDHSTRETVAVKGTAETRQEPDLFNLLEPDDLEDHVRKLEAKYRRAQELEQRWNSTTPTTPEILLVGYGITSRILRRQLEAARSQGLRVGLSVRSRFGIPVAGSGEGRICAQKVLVVELSTGQMVEDVRLASTARCRWIPRVAAAAMFLRWKRSMLTCLALLASVVHSEPQGQFTSRSERRIARRFEGAGQRAGSPAQRLRSRDSKSPVFYEKYDARTNSSHQTHYCPGCGHGVAHKLIAEAIEDLACRIAPIFVSPVGCSVFA